MVRKIKCCELILVWLFLSVINPVYGNWKKPQIINLNKEIYKADNKNWSIGQDERGILYFGNDVGLLEFDGIEWKLNQLPNQLTARSVAVLSHQTVFTGSYEEFGRWDRDISGKLVYTSLSALLPDGTFNNEDFWKICIAEDGVYFQSFASIYKYTYDTVRQVYFDQAVLFLQEARGRYLVQEISGGLLEIKDLDVVPLGGKELFAHTDVRVILPYGENQYLIGTAMQGLYLYDGQDFQVFNPVLSDLMSKKELNCAILSAKGTYFLGTILDGIYEIDPNGEILNHISSQNTLQNNTILALYEDSRNNIWAALDRGISYIQYLTNMSCITEPAGSTGTFYDVALWQDKWFLGTNQGVFYIHADDIHTPDVFRDMKLIEGAQEQVWKLKVMDNQLFCCHNRGIKEIRPDLTVVDNYSLRTGVNDVVKSVVKGKEVYLFSTYNSLKIALPGTYEVLSPEGISEPVSATFTDHLNNIWLEHPNKGVYRCQVNDDLKSYRNYTYYGQDDAHDLPYKLFLFKIGGAGLLY
ncbi:MAG: hypothetical protein LUJ25_09845 [Firmicutes bacterium]|nr:hypothetical protein [Bacillota bacterium]